jgi:hypothetical protein
MWRCHGCEAVGLHRTALAVERELNFLRSEDISTTALFSGFTEAVNEVYRISKIGKGNRK